jgi:hypothetical protein
MPSLYSEIEINAPKSAIWQALIRKEDWLKWNTFLYDRNPALPFRQGQIVQLSLRRMREETETEFEPRILLVQPNVCLRWVYTAPGFRSEHCFELQEIGRNRTQYIHQETVTGAVTVLFTPFLKRDEQRGIRRMAREIKQYVEQTGSPV